MRWLDRIENRFHWIAFPGLFKYLAMLGVLVSAASWLKPDILEIISFDRDRIFAGEVWRIFSFAFAPLGVFGFGTFSVLFLFFATMIAFLVSDSLEEAWGSTRTTLYIVTCWLALIVGQFMLNLPATHMAPAGIYLYNAMFLAFATLFPTVEFRLMLILPIQVRWLGWLSFGLMVLSVLQIPALILLVLPSLVPYALWVLPDFIRTRKGLVDAAARRRKFENVSSDTSNAFHHCAVCKRTENDDSDLEFRTYPDGNEYCVEHLPEENSD